MVRRRIQIYTNAIYTNIYDQVEILFQQALRYIMLILSDTNAFWVDLDQLGQRILQSPCDRNRATNRQIQIGEFLSGNIARTIDTGAGFVDKHNRKVETIIFQHLANKTFGFTSRSAVTDSYCPQVSALDAFD